MISDVSREVGRLPVVTATDRPKRELEAKLADRVFEAVKREIVENRLRPEQILAEAALAERFEVSRAPAREALQRLARAGFVRTIPRVGYIVTTVSVRDFDEVFQMRFALEPLAAELATSRITEADAQRLDELARRGTAIIDSKSPARPTELAHTNAAFHREVARLAGSRRLEHTVGGLLDELERVMHMLADDPSLATARDQHPTLVRTMREGDAVAARRLMGEQLHHDYEIMRPLAIRGEAGVLTSQRP
jgi:DNA-binding GntR family transcriptional regulator